MAEKLKQQGIQATVDRNPANRTSGGDQLYFTDPRQDARAAGSERLSGLIVQLKPAYVTRPSVRVGHDRRRLLVEQRQVRSLASVSARRRFWRVRRVARLQHAVRAAARPMRRPVSSDLRQIRASIVRQRGEHDVADDLQAAGADGVERVLRRVPRARSRGR